MHHNRWADQLLTLVLVGDAWGIMSGGGGEACRLAYFDGVPPSFGALIRHIQGWYIAKGGRVPDESTLKRRLRKFWTIFGPEAQDKAT